MNYKIRITAENQAIVKRIADENGMNAIGYNFSLQTVDWNFYAIENNKFCSWNNKAVNYPELTTEQFIAMFDKKKTELDKWLRETKAKNLSLVELIEYINMYMPFSMYHKIRSQSNLSQIEDVAKFLFNQWNKEKGAPFEEESPKAETEWQPKRGDRVLVCDDDNSYCERIFLAQIKGCKLPIRVVAHNNEGRFFNNEEFSSEGYKFMKPLPIEQPKETYFKTKVIELIEGKINDLKGYEKRQIEINEYYNNHSQVASKIKVYNDLINDIKQL